MDSQLVNSMRFCDNQSHTISIIKVKDSNEILGGYNPIIWKSDDTNGTTKDSFIFSFKNKENIKENILSRGNCESFATYNDPNTGPTFGWRGDLILCGVDNNGGSVQGMLCYESIRELGFFPIEEFEVFQIMKD